ncbi:MAG: hypothetical protein NTW28_15875 [Candidatus Solibacter sp.]|nr:hypothetical protein [Candidatus Solibacter sp.]
MRTISLLLLCSQALAYTPPTDTVGPITVSMQPAATGTYGAGGYADLSRPNLPFVVPVTLQNSSDREISGTLRLAVVDQWKVEPATAVAFRLGPRGRRRQEFTLTFGPGTLSAHYPIHAYAEFEDQGRKMVAHPVMIVQPRIPDVARPRLPVEWKPVPVPNGGMLGLWRIPVRRERTEMVRLGADAGQVGREVFDAGTVILYGPLARSEKEGIAMTLGPRPPSRRETVDAASVEYPLALPAARPLRLVFAAGGSATVAVKAAPFEGGEFRTLYERKSAAGPPEAATVDLASFAGANIRLRFEARDSAGEAQWVEPAIVAGNAPQPRPTR